MKPGCTEVRPVSLRLGTPIRIIRMSRPLNLLIPIEGNIFSISPSNYKKFLKEYIDTGDFPDIEEFGGRYIGFTYPDIVDMQVWEARETLKEMK